MSTVSDVTFKQPVSVLVLVYASTGEVLLLERRQPRHFWQSVTGSIEADETLRETAQRELFEETGLQVDDDLIDCDQCFSYVIPEEWRVRYAPDVEKNEEHIFRLQVDSPASIVLSREHIQYVWLPKRQAIEQVSSWTNRDVIRRWVPDK